MPDFLNSGGKNGGIDSKPGPWWWFRQILLTGLACFFVYFGISLLVASYGLNDPFSFIMTFFAASLIILISAVMVLGFVVRMRWVLRAAHVYQEDETDQ